MTNPKPNRKVKHGRKASQPIRSSVSNPEWRGAADVACGASGNPNPPCGDFEAESPPACLAHDAPNAVAEPKAQIVIRAELSPFPNLGLVSNDELKLPLRLRIKLAMGFLGDAVSVLFGRG